MHILISDTLPAQNLSHTRLLVREEGVVGKLELKDQFVRQVFLLFAIKDLEKISNLPRHVENFARTWQEQLRVFNQMAVVDAVVEEGEEGDELLVNLGDCLAHGRIQLVHESAACHRVDVKADIYWELFNVLILLGEWLQGLVPLFEQG